MQVACSLQPCGFVDLLEDTLSTSICSSSLSWIMNMTHTFDTLKAKAKLFCVYFKRKTKS